MAPFAILAALATAIKLSRQAATLSAVSSQPAPSAHASAAAAELGERGFAVLGAGARAIDASVCATVASECSARLERLIEAADSAGCAVFDQQYSFAEICHRKRLRWDMRMDDSAAWRALCAAAVGQAAPVLRELCGGSEEDVRVVMSGVVVSRAGALAQRFHADGSGRLWNVFVPLVDIAPDADGTQFWPGSQGLDLPEAAVLSLSAEPGAMAAMVSPGLETGGLLLFDYRCVHRGLPNGGRERAVAYVVLALGEEGGDVHNFPERSVFGCSAEAAEAMPFWDAALGNTWRALRPRLRAELSRLARSLAERGAEAGAEAGEALEAEPNGAFWLRRAQAAVRARCAADGLDRWSAQAQLMAARQLLAELLPPR